MRGVPELTWKTVVWKHNGSFRMRETFVWLVFRTAMVVRFQGVKDRIGSARVRLAVPPVVTVQLHGCSLSTFI